jgi:hypothetical protein
MKQSKKKLGVPFAVCMHTAKIGKEHTWQQPVHPGRPFGQAKRPLPCSLFWWHTAKREAFAVFPRRWHTAKKGKGVGRAVSSPCSSHGVAHGKEKILPCSLMVGTRQRSSDVAPSVKSRFRQLHFCRVLGWKAHGKGFAVFRAERHTAKVLCRAVFRRVDFAVFRHTARALPCSEGPLPCILPTRQSHVFP